MYAMVQTQSGTPYAGIKGMLRTIFGLDHLGDDAFAVKKALLKVRAVLYLVDPIRVCSPNQNERCSLKAHSLST